MKLPSPLIQGRLIKRYKRFLADIELVDGGMITAHCANPGSMLGLKEPGMEVWVSKSSNPKRKLQYSWELVAVDGILVGINTGYPNRIVEEAITSGAIGQFSPYDSIRREVRYGENSRIDLLLESPDLPPVYVEVKNVHMMREPGLAEFPDAVTSRGTKHLQELERMVRKGCRAAMVYLVQYPTADRLQLAGDIDPEYQKTFNRVTKNGVEACAYVCNISHSEIVVREQIPIVDLQA